MPSSSTPVKFGFSIKITVGVPLNSHGKMRGKNRVNYPTMQNYTYPSLFLCEVDHYVCGGVCVPREQSCEIIWEVRISKGPNYLGYYCTVGLIGPFPFYTKETTLDNEAKT